MGVRSIDLRAGQISDLPVIEAIMRSAFDPRYGEAWTGSQCAGVLAMPGVWLTIAEVGGAPAGFSMTRTIADESELLLLAVSPAYRRQGIGGALLRAAVGEAERRGAIYIHLEVRAGNPATELYRATGFEKIGERRGYYRGKDGKLFDAQTFRRAIGL
jgi:ribosomal-protein-alanine N-acetyltransferase